MLINQYRISRPIVHIGFWLLYFLSFGFIWGRNGEYWQSYYLEFILLPVRMLAVYTTLYVLIPRFLKPRKLWSLVGAYLMLIAISALLQRVFTYYFYEGNADMSYAFWDLGGILRNVILINSTVVFVAALKITQLWWQEGESNRRLTELVQSLGQPQTVEIKADKRIHRINVQDILYVEGLGNYVVYYTQSQKLISYTSLKQALEQLPSQFVRIHKSYLINSQKINSYDQESVEIGGREIPMGRSYRGSLSLGA